MCKKDKTKKNGVVSKARKHQELTPRSTGVTIKFCPFIDDPNLYDGYVAEQKEKKRMKSEKANANARKKKKTKN